MIYVIAILVVAIVASLAEAMYYLARDSGSRARDRVVKALTLRIGLSLLLFILLMLGIGVGVIEPHGVIR